MKNYLSEIYKKHQIWIDIVCSFGCNKEQAEELLAPSIPIYTSYIEQIDNIFDQVYNQNTKQDLRKKATTEVETTTVTGGETGFGEMGMGASDVVTTKSLPYTEFEQEAKK